MRRLTNLGVVIAASLLAAACSSSPTPSGPASPSGPSGVLSLSNEAGSTWTCGFSPFNGSVSFLSVGPVYEPLVFVNTLQSGKTTPWLASSYKWSNGNKTVTFTIRKNVKFSDGSPMGASDVVFTFNMLKRFPALDINSVWSVLSSVTQQGSDQVVMTFKTAAVPYFYYIADQVGIVPQKIWSKLKNPVTFTDANPIGTGAYTVKCSPQLITYTANAHYYQPGEPHIETVLYPAYTSNDPANVDLATGKAQWGSQFIPSIKKFYTSKSASYHYWFPPTANVSMFINLKDPVLSDVHVRQAMAYAIDRQKVSTVGEYGYEPASNQTGIVTPTFSTWVDRSAAAKFGNYSYSPSKAMSILAADGYKKDSNGLMAKNGKELSFSIINVGGYSDWVASVQVIQQDLQAVGIKLEQVMLSQVPGIPVTESVDWYQYDTAKFNGWVTPQDPFAQPSIYTNPDWGIVLLHL